MKMENLLFFRIAGKQKRMESVKEDFFAVPHLFGGIQKLSTAKKLFSP